MKMILTIALGLGLTLISRTTLACGDSHAAANAQSTDHVGTQMAAPEEMPVIEDVAGCSHSKGNAKNQSKDHGKGCGCGSSCSESSDSSPKKSTS